VSAPIGDSFVRTVCGDIRASELGRVNYHEHLFQVSPLLVGDELDDEEASTREAESVRVAGTTTIVEATPTGLGRNVDAVVRISEAVGLNIVHVTGAHKSAHYAASEPLLSASENALADLFVRDIVVGFPEASRVGVRAGIVKAAIGYWSMPPFERRVLAAAAITHGVSGAPVMVHLDHGSAAHEVLDVLAADGVPADAVVLAHMDRNLDPGLHKDLAARGAYLGYDGAARHREAPDSAILACLAQVVADSAGSRRVVLGGDVARASRYREYGGLPGLDYLDVRFVPRLVDTVGEDAANAILSRNPSHWLSFRAVR
tara:strand:+ start:696 stop:1643 length:948 start_codon:yes stop_codon:yes gene_type:complete